jgi:rod shape-determining protein MreD
VPWGLPATTGFVLPLMTAMLVFLFASWPEARLPPWLVFLAGMLTDMLTAGPLGYWAFIFLVAYALGRAIAFSAARRDMLSLLGVYALTAAFTAATAWGVASLYYMRLIDWQPMAFAALAVAALFPVLVRVSGYRRRTAAWAG